MGTHSKPPQHNTTQNGSCVYFSDFVLNIISTILLNINGSVVRFVGRLSGFSAGYIVARRKYS